MSLKEILGFPPICPGRRPRLCMMRGPQLQSRSQHRSDEPVFHQAGLNSESSNKKADWK
jgi:hypothetical protein